MEESDMQSPGALPPRASDDIDLHFIQNPSSADSFKQSFSDGDMGFEGDARAQYDDADGEDDDPPPVKLSASPSDHDDAKREDRSAPERLFGAQRTADLRRRLARSSNVSEAQAQDALEQATQMLESTTGTEGIEFFTWCTVWILVLFYLLFFSPWGDLLWDFLMGPLGFLLMLPFAFALLFWILTYIFQSS